MCGKQWPRKRARLGGRCVGAGRAGTLVGVAAAVVCGALLVAALADGGDRDGGDGASAAPDPAEARDEGFSLPVDGRALDRGDPAYRTSYAPVLKEAREAVVAVHSAQVVRFIRSRGMDPREELLRRFFGLPAPDGGGEPRIEERRLPQGLGSGVVIDPEGYILTNNHVITSRDGGRADEILVRLNDGRELEAAVVGRDPPSDLAVLKVEAEALPHLAIADSDRLQVGDIVFAVGNPMGVGLTITQGIVSATGRSNLSILGRGGYESFIQTDAPINPGNSGGALVDAYGRLVGINTAILSRSGGSIGLGFAIPSNFARHVATALIREGEVRRGVLGVHVEDVDRDYAEAFDAPDTRGALIQSLRDGYPADEAGLRKGDIVRAINGAEVADADDLRLKVARHPPGAEIVLTVLRDGKRREIGVVLGNPEDPPGGGDTRGELLSGVEAAVLDERYRSEFGLERDLEGLVILGVDASSPYAEVLRPGGVILTINGERPRSVERAAALLRSRPVSYLYYYHEGRAGYFSVRPGR